MKSIMAIATLAALAPYAAAQQQAARPHPADPAAPIAAATHASAFAGYRGIREEPLAPWREVNDEVARAGGHVGILRGGNPAARPSSNTPALPAQQ